METISAFVTEQEATAERVYREVYATEYMRVYEPRLGTDREHQLFWSELAHRAAKAARERFLAEPVEVL